MLIFKVAIVLCSKRNFLNVIQNFLNQNAGRREPILCECTSQVSSRLQVYLRKEDELLIPCNSVLSVQSGGHTVLLDKCTPPSASSVCSTEGKS